MPLAVHLLGLAIFAQGTSEFMLSGLLPNIATDLGVSLSDAGLLISAFAIGMVVGAPVLAVATLRVPRRTALIAFQLVFVAGHVVGALAPGYGVLFATRIVSAVAYAGFWAVAAATAVSLVPQEVKGRAMSVVAMGLTLATVVGVPAGTVLSQHAGWRTAFWAVAALTLLSALSLRAALPAVAGGTELPNLRRELTGLACPRLWLSYLITTLTFGAGVVTFSYLAPLLTEVTGLPAGWVPAVLALYGIGGLIGITVGGRYADSAPLRTLIVGAALLTLASAALARTAAHLPVTLVLVPVLGFTAYLVNPVVQSRVFRLAPDAPTLVPAVNTSAFNVGITLTPMLGGLTIDAGLGLPSVAWVGAATGLLGLAATAWAATLERRNRPAPPPLTATPRTPVTTAATTDS
ncbi:MULTISPECIES: Cmx/CmrA family chloramphenicol efflux MFS transporter [unclassified Streptomyces]|uniref:Cmx/CmrA family chloramphenicol efflux MFS transporter n=1 Tax=unclassified Streptomyces TaxID=2593676 RepID=UPI0003813488|nr:MULTISPECIES: Cmx/CmrA family chloramphenicol efflux MFS transporter [unclassified Streptomyces]MYT33442.1 Cmx/CmrA family chloramphenicol efflux MFS transporter [Streptomyces sp. SID8354]